MIEGKDFDRVMAALSFLQGADPDTVREFQASAFLTRIPPGRDVFTEGDQVGVIPLLISGVVRVYQIGATGREVTLYRFGTGESCVLTANAILGQDTFPAIATVEEEAEAVMIPAEVFREWVRRDELWSGFYFHLVSQRLARVMAVVDEVAFQRLDARVASLLLDRREQDSPIRITHQEIAAELGSSREVISRVLERFASRGLIQSERGLIRILEAESLRSLTAT